jgi:pimeloyl-ACP methyl ester carboxylesterase
MAAEESQWSSAGARIAGKRWRNGARPVLALHGWLDNAASFDALGPLLAGADVVGLDLPGHGLCAHRPPQATYNIWDDLPDVLRVADQLGWQRFDLLGHSRGAIMAALLTAALPERVAATVLLDGLCPEPVPIADTYRQLGRFLRDHVYAQRAPSRYDSPQRALQVRCEIAAMSEQAARPLVERGLQRVGDSWQWRADARLQLASAFKLSAEHVAVLQEQLAPRPHLLLLAERGAGGRMRGSGELAALRGIRWEMLPGSHHFHLEQAAPLIAAKIGAFWCGLDAGAAAET